MENVQYFTIKYDVSFKFFVAVLYQIEEVLFDLLCFPLKDSFRDSFLYSPSQDIKHVNL